MLPQICFQNPPDVALFNDFINSILSSHFYLILLYLNRIIILYSINVLIILCSLILITSKSKGT
jgi:uncharacterized MnhB-related membrane protein